MEDQNFGAVLTRLLTYRRADVPWLSVASGVPEAGLHAVIAGVPPSREQLDVLAPVLGFRPDDLYVIAGVRVPDAPVPWDAPVASEIGSFVQTTAALPQEQRSRLHRLVRDMPREIPDGPHRPARTYDPGVGGFGAMIVTMLCGNRNLSSLSATVRIVGLLTDRPGFVSPSTIHAIGWGRIPLTPDSVKGFAEVLGIAPGDLAAVTGLESPQPSDPCHSDPYHPLAAEMAELLWDCRHLTSDQLVHVFQEARSMLVAVPDGADEEDWNRVHYESGTWWGAPKR